MKIDNMFDSQQSYQHDRDSGSMEESEYTVSECLGRVNNAMKWRKDAGFDDKWAKIIKMYANQYEYSELSGYEDVVAPNMMFSTANVIVPSVMVNYPKITVSARKPEFEPQAQVVEAVANYYWQHYNFHEEMKLAVRDFVFLGLGIVKNTWVSEEEEVELSRDEWIAAVQAALLEVQNARIDAERNGLDVQFPSDDEVIALVPTKQMKTVEDRPNAERVSPFDLYFDPDSTRLSKCRWLAQRMYVPFQEAKENESWNLKARKKLKPSAMSAAKKDYDLTFQGEQRGNQADFVIVWEYYDLLENTVATFAEGCDMWLAKPEEIEYSSGHPFEFLLNYEIPEKLYPMGDLESIVPLQMELALTRTQMVNDRKRYRRMYMYKPDEIGPDGLAALLSSDDNAMIPVDTDGPMSDVIVPVTTTALPPEFYNQTGMILDDMDRTTAVTEYQRGSVAEVRRTATEAAMIQDMSNARSADKLAKVEQAISRIARRTVQLCQEFLSSDQVAKFESSNGQVLWIEFDRDAVQGEFDFIVEAGSTQPMNETFRRQSSLQLLDAMGPFISAGVIDPRSLAEHVLRYGFGVKDPGSFMVQQQPMMPGMPNGMPSEAGGMPGGMPPEGAPPMGAPPMGQAPM